MKRPPRHKPPIKIAPPVTRNRDPFYHTSRWKRESKNFLTDSGGFCIMCKKKGILTPADVTDHIIPKPVCKDPWDQSNWQPLCKRCNNHKGRTTDKLNIRKNKRL